MLPICPKPIHHLIFKQVFILGIESRLSGRGGTPHPDILVGKGV
jgi:hypothetical protein